MNKIIITFVVTVFLYNFSKIYGAYCVVSTEHFPTIGMFAATNLVIGQIHLYERGDLPDYQGLKIDFGQHGLYYESDHGPNWWSYFFEPVSLGITTSSPFYISWEEGCDAFRAKNALPREKAIKLVKKYIRIQPHIQKKVECFVEDHFYGDYIIGVHYRGTDKHSEAPRIDYNVIINAVRVQIPKEKSYQIFVASDEQSFVETMQQQFSSQIVTRDVHRAIGLEGVHFSDHNGYQLGEEALIDSLLLSKCDLLIRTSSNLSLWSTYFQPHIPVILLSERYEKCAEPE